MRFTKKMLASVTGLLFTIAGSAMAAPLALLQDPQTPVQVDVHTTTTHTVWYADPVWLAIGGVVVLLIIVLAVVAARGRDTGTSTTVVR